MLLDKGTYRVTCATWQPPQETHIVEGDIGVRRIGQETPVREPAALTVSVPERAVYALSVRARRADPKWLDYIEIAPLE